MVVFAVFCAGFAAFSHYYVPETANSTANETLAKFGIGLPKSDLGELLLDKHDPELDSVPPLRSVISPTSSYHSNA